MFWSGTTFDLWYLSNCSQVSKWHRRIQRLDPSSFIFSKKDAFITSYPNSRFRQNFTYFYSTLFFRSMYQHVYRNINHPKTMVEYSRGNWTLVLWVMTTKCQVVQPLNISHSLNPPVIREPKQGNTNCWIKKRLPNNYTSYGNTIK